MGTDAVTTDEQLLEIGMAKFGKEAVAKFLAGMAEHNPNGNKHLCRLSARQLLEQQKYEIIDQWFYICALEQKLNEGEK